MTNHNPPWNKGKKGIEAGWTEERREQYSERQKKWMQENPDNPIGRPGPRPDIWKTGPDPKVREHYYRFLKARNQAKFWKQPWSILWEDYLDLWKTAPGEWGRDASALNLTRIDTSEGWHLWNVRLVERSEAMRRPTKGNVRERPKGLGSKKRGIQWRGKK